jgi:molybdopterin molybdotransferase
MEKVIYHTSISYTRALDLIHKKASEKFQNNPEVVSIENCLSRVLASDVKSKIDVPAFNNSAMDGYAIRHSDLAQQKQGWLDLQSPQFAGDSNQQVLEQNSAIPIMTGALLPEMADTIVIKENSEVKNDQVYLRDIGSKGAYVRFKGNDIKTNCTILKKGVRLKPQDIGLLASVGCKSIVAYPTVKVVIFTGGDEIIQPGETLEVGKIYDSVRPTLVGLLKSLNCEIIHVGSLKDDPAQIKAAFDPFANENTIIITNGGVSAGDKDYILQVMQEHGDITFHKTNIKPGFPILFGEYKKALFFGLPGNPVSSFVTISQYLIPALRILEGESIKATGFVRAKLTRGYSKQHYRREFVRARLSYDATFGFEVTVAGNQSSGRLSSVTDANCFIVFDETPNEFQSGEMVNVQRFIDLLYPHLL